MGQQDIGSRLSNGRLQETRALGDRAAALWKREECPPVPRIGHRDRTGKAWRPWLGFVLFASTGCSKAPFPATGEDLARSSVGKVARLVYEFRIGHRGAMPRDQAELKGFADSMDADYRSRLGLGDPDTFFASDRDGSPLILKLGNATPSREGSSVVCYEKEGVEGVRLVGKIGGEVEAADAQRFAELVPNP